MMARRSALRERRERALEPAEPVNTEKIDPALVASLYVKHADELRRFVLGVVRDPEQATDVLQATFAKAVEMGHTAREETLKGWLFRVAFHEALAQKRKQAVRDKAARRIADEGSQASETPYEQVC